MTGYLGLGPTKGPTGKKKSSGSAVTVMQSRDKDSSVQTLIESREDK